VQFIVNEFGEVENPKVIKGIGGGCDENALEAVKLAKFEPGLHNGDPVKVQYSLPIVFRLND
jgi:protein TonB